jgi:glutamate-1-semialdehyde aminotransferase
VLGCGYHGWLDGTSSGPGVPGAVSALFASIPFNDPDRSVAAIRAAGPELACVVVEPVVDAAPSAEWLGALRAATRECGALLVFDEIKTALRVGLGGAAARYGGDPDLLVLGKAIANGFPLAAVGGPAEIMDGVRRTWISSTLATEAVALSAARATLEVARDSNLTSLLDGIGRRLHQGLARLAAEYPAGRARVSGIPEMCYLRYEDEATGGDVARACARRGLLFKRNAYNFVSLAHRESDVDFALEVLEESLRAC